MLSLRDGDSLMPDLVLSRVNNRQQDKLSEIADFLGGFDLLIDKDVEYFVVAYSRNTFDSRDIAYSGASADAKDKIVACGGIAGNILKSIAISRIAWHGFFTDVNDRTDKSGLRDGTLPFVPVYQATECEVISSVRLFPVERADDKLVLLENSQCNLKNYCRKLNQKK